MMDTRKLYDVRQELSREHGNLVASVSRRQITAADVEFANPCRPELVRLVLIQEALRALELLMKSYADRVDVAGNRDPDPDVSRFHHPTPEQTNVVLVDERTLLKAEDLMTGCEACSPNARLAFEYLLDALSGCDTATTEYLLRRPAQCPRCRARVTEKTMVSYL